MGSTVIFSALTYAPTLLSMFFVNKMKKWFGNMVNVIIFSLIVNIVFRLIAYFVGYEGNLLWISTILLALGAFPSGVLGIATTSLFNDSIDYIEWKTGKRTEGVVFSMQTLLAKIASGITSGLSLLFLYFVMGYVPSPDTVTVTLGFQGEKFNKLIWPLFILTPAIGNLLYIIPLLWAKYPKDLKALVESDLTARRKGLPESGKSPYIQEK
jgi:Na+/melibiose symporter-like transporter